MDKAAKKITEVLLFIYLSLFPFGQILSFSLTIFGFSLRIHPIDFIVGLSGLTFLITKLKVPKVATSIFNFLIILSFSLLSSLTFFELKDILPGILYLTRIVFYFLFFLGVWNYVRSERIKNTIFNSLILVSLAIAVLGLFQYFVYPDVRPFTVWEWDDHLFRLVSTFLDPGFAGIILVLGFLLSLAKFLKSKRKYLIFLMGAFLTSIALTYSRASYVSLFFGTGLVLLLTRKIKKIFILLAIFLTIILLIPSWGSEGVRLLRTKSIFARVESYKEAITLFSKSPLFGVGYNNLCIAKERFLGQPANYSSHSCSGVESGLLLTLATSGVIGFLSFLTMLVKIVKAITKDIFGNLFTASLLAVITHSLFVNSLFYPWVMGYLAVLLSLSLKERNLR